MSIGVGEGIELSATACTLLNNNKLGVSTYITTLKRTSLNSPYACIVYVRQANFTTKSRFKNLSSLICHFRVSPGLCMKTRLSAQAFDMKTIFHSHANKTYFHKKGCALSLIFKVRVLGTRKWPIDLKRILIHKESKCKESCSQITLGGEICSFDVNTHQGYCVIRISL